MLLNSSNTVLQNIHKKYKHQNNNKAREEVSNMNARRTMSKRPWNKIGYSPHGMVEKC